MEVLTDKIEQPIEIGALVTYSDRYPNGTGAYIGQVSHITKDSGRVAIIRPDLIFINPDTAIWKDRKYKITLPLTFSSKADVYRHEKSIIVWNTK